MPANCHYCGEPTENNLEAFHLMDTYQRKNQINMMLMGPIPQAHYYCIESPQDLDQDQQIIWTFLKTMQNSAALETMKKDVVRIEDALLQSTDPSLTPLQDEIRHIRETYPTGQPSI